MISFGTYYRGSQIWCRIAFALVVRYCYVSSQPTSLLTLALKTIDILVTTSLFSASEAGGDCSR